jgi:hypothetical protein
MGGIHLDRLKKDSQLLFSKYEKIKNIEGMVSEAEAISMLNCSSSTFHRWRKRLRIRRFMSVSCPLYYRKDIERIRLYRQFGTLIRKLKNLNERKKNV